MNSRPQGSGGQRLGSQEAELYAVSRKKGTDSTWHNFDKFKCIVVIFCEKYHEGNAKLLIQSKVRLT